MKLRYSLFTSLLFFLFGPATFLAAENLQNRNTLFSATGWSSGIGIPVAYHFKTAADGSKLSTSSLPEGIALELYSPFQIGFGVEAYRIKLDNKIQPSGTMNRLVLIMVDLSYKLDISRFFVSLGGGYGYSWIDGENSDSVKPTGISQIFLKPGFKVNRKTGIYLGLHSIVSQLELKNSDSLLETGGNMISTGIVAEF